MSAQAGPRLQHQHHHHPTSSRLGHGQRTRVLGAVRPLVLGAARLLFVPLASAAPLLSRSTHLHLFEDDADAPKDAEDPSLWLYLGIAVILVLLGGVFAGLTIALMGQDETYLHVIATSGEGSEKNNAEKVLNLLKKGKHWVLVTLLLSNVITNETLPIVLDRSLGGGWPAVVSSTVLIVIFGEVAPQSVCVRYGLSIGAFMAPAVLGLMWLMSPIAWPTAKLLDYLLGEDHGTMYKKSGLKTLVTLHKTLGSGAGDRLMEDEVTIINSVLDLKDKAVGSIMTPMGDVFTMSADTVLDERMMDTILSQGYSRIPIYAPDNNRNFIGMLLVKILITYDPEDCKRVRDFALATLPETAPHTSCLDIINFFQEGKSHMVLVSDYPGQDRGATGVVTLEDVIEELIGEEIIDESDVFVDVHKAIRRMAPAPKTRFRQHRADTFVNDEDDDGKEADEQSPLLKKDGDGSRKPSLVNGQTSFLVRRKSSAASDSMRDRPVSVPLRSTKDISEHLKHLGPSNAASRPKATKYTSVKIKPGVGTIPEDKSTTTGADPGAVINPSSPAPPAETVDEAVEALRSGSRGRGASDGASAVYGNITTPPSVRRLSAASNKVSAQEASRIASENTFFPPDNRNSEDTSREEGKSHPNIHQPKADDRADETDDEQSLAKSGTVREPLPTTDTFKQPDKLVVGGTSSYDKAREEDDYVGELSQSNSGDQPKKRTQARSGSITETTMEIGGLRKVVLEASSSSEEGYDEADKSLDGTRRKGSAGNEGQSSSTNNDAAAGGEGGQKRRKKRGKKKRGGSDGT